MKQLCAYLERCTISVMLKADLNLSVLSVLKVSRRTYRSRYSDPF
jgi:hypothetical protein